MFNYVEFSMKTFKHTDMFIYIYKKVILLVCVCKTSPSARHKYVGFNAEALVSIIKNNILLKTMGTSDCWKAYSKPEEGQRLHSDETLQKGY